MVAGIVTRHGRPREPASAAALSAVAAHMIVTNTPRNATFMKRRGGIGHVELASAT
jgi:hypothetical protein